MIHHDSEYDVKRIPWIFTLLCLPQLMNTAHRKSLPGTSLDYFDARTAVDAIAPGAFERLPYTSRVLAENLVRRCDPSALTASLKQLIERKRDLD